MIQYQILWTVISTSHIIVYWLYALNLLEFSPQV